MKTNGPKANEESPARRLDLLYLASLSMIAILLALGQVLIVKELGRRSSMLNEISRAARQVALDESLSQAVLSVLAEHDPTARQRHLEALRAAVESRRAALPTPPSPEAPTHEQNTPAAASDRLLLKARPQGIAAIEAAETLLATLGGAGPAPAPAPAAEIRRLVQTIIAAESASHTAAEEAMAYLERQGASEIDRLERLESSLFALVMVVLLIEGTFVISPAVRKIQAFMDDIRRSHAELKSYAARLERSNKELQDFASVASHDLQEPLRKIQAFGDRLQSKCGAALDDQGRDYLERIRNAAKRMQVLINDLLTFSRVTTKAQPFVPTDLGATTREVVNDLEARIEEVQGRVELGDLPLVEADPLQMRQLMQNLIGNALKYHRRDVPPVVKVYSQPVADRARDQCQILIDDNGIGFEEIYAERIFTIFQRLHGRSEYEGTGVGLAVCRKIVERHGGSITARSTPGAGSSFIVTLPTRHAKETDNHGPTV